MSQVLPKHFHPAPVLGGARVGAVIEADKLGKLGPQLLTDPPVAAGAFTGLLVVAVTLRRRGTGGPVVVRKVPGVDARQLQVPPTMIRNRNTEDGLLFKIGRMTSREQKKDQSQVRQPETKKDVGFYVHQNRQDDIQAATRIFRNSNQCRCMHIQYVESVSANVL